MSVTVDASCPLTRAQASRSSAVITNLTTSRKKYVFRLQEERFTERRHLPKLQKNQARKTFTCKVH